MYSIFTKYTPDVEMASIDEAYLDITGCKTLHKLDYPEIARNISMEINRKLGLSVSCGMASSKVVSKVASSQNKPHKLSIVPYGGEAKFLAPLPLRAMPGIGPKTFAVLESFGFKTLGELAALTLNEVMQKFGVHGVPLWKHARGIDDSEVISSHALPKSISKENTFYENAVGEATALKELQELGSIVFSKLRASGLRAKTICVKIRYRNLDAGSESIFKDFSFQQNLDFPTSLDNKLWPPIKKLFLKNLDQNEQLRLIGVGVSNLIQNYNLNLFDNDGEQEKLFSQIDAMKKMYGDESVKYGI
jgi:DNA polymerase-4